MITSINIVLEGIWESGAETGAEMLKKWAEEIITECAGNFECSMETDDYVDENGEEVKVTEPYPVLMRESINRVRSQLK